MLKDEFNYYTCNQDTIVSGHLGEFVVVKDRNVLGYFKNEIDAFIATKKYTLGTFMVKQCKTKGTDVVNFYNSQVRFG
jgi:hypothetical protein